jgi:hypothetical protein
MEVLLRGCIRWRRRFGRGARRLDQVMLARGAQGTPRLERLAEMCKAAGGTSDPGAARAADPDGAGTGTPTRGALAVVRERGVSGD